MLTADLQQGAAGGQHLQRRTGASRPATRSATAGSEMLAVVQQQQRLPGAQEPGQFAPDRRVRDQGESQRFGHSRQDTRAGSATAPDRPRPRRRRRRQPPPARWPGPGASCRRPPGPVRVRSGTASSSRRSRAAARSASRPMRRVRGMGTDRRARCDEAEAAIGDVPTESTTTDAHSVPDSALGCVENHGGPKPRRTLPSLMRQTIQLPSEAGECSTSAEKPSG